MTGHRFSGGLYGLLFLCCLVVYPSSCMPCANEEEPLFTETDAFISNTIMTLSLERFLPRAENVTQNISSAFTEGICPLFHYYTLHHLGSQHLSDTESITHNSLVSLLLQNVLELSCDHVKLSVPESEELSRVNCTVTSLAQLCFNLETELQLTGVLRKVQQVEIIRHDKIESWLRKVLPGRELQSNVLQNLSSLLVSHLFTHCTFQPGQIECRPSV